MSVATEYLAPAPRPRLRVIHSCEPLVPAAPVPAGAPDDRLASAPVTRMMPTIDEWVSSSP